MSKEQAASNGETRLRGAPLAPGVAFGRPCFFEWHADAPNSSAATAPADEIQRLHDTLNRLGHQCTALCEETAAVLGPEHAEIFETHRLMLADTALHRQFEQVIESRGCRAQDAVGPVLAHYREMLAASDSSYLQQRVADIDEIEHALLGELNRSVAGRHCRDASDCTIDHCRLANDHILVGREIAASLPVETDAHTTGFVVERAGRNSHAVILARALRRPVVGDIQNPPGVIPCRADLLVDGDAGLVILNPSAQTLSDYRERRVSESAVLQPSEPVQGMDVLANISLSTEVSDALAAGAEGVGLYRTEMEFLAAGRPLSEDEQTLRYSQVVKAMAGRPVFIRLLDLHNDKAAAWLEKLPPSPTASTRQGHLLLDHPELLRAQARALVRASLHGPIHVLYPMITGVEQFRLLRNRFTQASRDLRPGDLRHGVLFEVPAACLAAPMLLQAADFASIGTNDLIQYLFAMDRGDDDVQRHDRLETGSVLWELIANLSQAAARARKPISVCGELAGNPEMTCRLLHCGIATVSTSPAHVAAVRRAVTERCPPPA